MGSCTSKAAEAIAKGKTDGAASSPEESQLNKIRETSRRLEMENAALEKQIQELIQQQKD